MTTANTNWETDPGQPVVDVRVPAKPHPVLALLHPIFAECLEPDNPRYDLSLPFLRPDGLVYATDGKIAVRMESTDAIRAALKTVEPRKTPDAAAVFTIPGGWDAERTPLPDLSDCPRCAPCSGAGQLPEIECPWCENEPGGCDECWDTDGKRPAGPCYQCHGSGYDPGEYDHNKGEWFGGSIEVGKGIRIAVAYAALLVKHGATLYLPTDPIERTMNPGQRGRRPEIHHRAIRFTVADGSVVGVLMPMTREASPR